MLSLTSDNKVNYLTNRNLFGLTKWKQMANPLYIKACQFFGATLIDRTNTIDSGIDFHIIDPINLISSTDKSFAEICNSRAKEIADKYPNKTIRILWSGGIDSTVTLISFLEYLKKRGDIQRVKVLLSEESIKEYPNFFEDIIKGKIDFTFIKNKIYENINDDEINITGEHGDQLFGSDKLQFLVEIGEAFRPYEELLEFVISRKLGSDKYTQAIIDYIEPQLKTCPIKIYSIYDYLWWMNFSMKWQNVTMRLIHGLSKNNTTKTFMLDQNIYHFFQSIEFQNWSISNHDIKILKDWKSYKYIAKEFIYNFHKDQNYLINKQKEPSLKEVLINKKSWFSFNFQKK